LVQSSTLKMEAKYSFKSWVKFLQIVWCYIQDDGIFFIIMAVGTSKDEQDDIIEYNILDRRGMR
jgi:hypothetical protein